MIERKSREKRSAALGGLKTTLGDLMGMSFGERNQSEVFESASGLLRWVSGSFLFIHSDLHPFTFIPPSPIVSFSKLS
jgi:hypothetical protein